MQVVDFPAVSLAGIARVFAPCRRLFALPDVRSLLFWSLCARAQVGGLPIAVTFPVAGWTGSNGLAGLAGPVAGGLTGGTAVAGPVTGWPVDTGGVAAGAAGAAAATAPAAAALGLAAATPTTPAAAGPPTAAPPPTAPTARAE
ncbi:hypothetical protein HNR25_004055 [Streptomonospora salina]|uniref:Uncharacterized protein n=1 Tax=Streptomonospora salina TaxID=104205 RepID=A0A841ED32_9ACTN|nr:hypothetical protein [Streptomonospora salina]